MLNIKMKTEELIEKQKKIVKEIYEQAEKMGLSNNDIAPITDGVCSIDGYLKSYPKVMWILKEPYDDFENRKPVGGGWSITEDCFGIKDDVWTSRTWQPIIYIMYGYIHGLIWQDMDYIRDNKKMADVLKDIAYINVSKMPGSTRSSWNNINQCYAMWKPILDKQLDLYNPDVIICAGTFSHFKEEFEKNDMRKVDSFKGYINVYHSYNKIVIDAYHPMQTQIDRGSYVDSIIEILNKYFPKH